MIIMAAIRINSVNGIAYKIFKNLNPDGTPTSITNTVTRLFQSTSSPSVPLGAAVAVADLRNDNTPDLVFAIYTSKGSGFPYTFKWTIAYDVQADGNPTSWSNVNEAEGIGDQVKDIGINISSNFTPEFREIILSAVDPNGLYFKWGQTFTYNGVGYFNTPLRTIPVTSVPAGLLGGGMDLVNFNGSAYELIELRRRPSASFFINVSTRRDESCYNADRSG